MSRLSFLLVAVTLLAVVGNSSYSQAQAQNQAPRPVRSQADETLAMWNSIGNKLIAMAQDFPEDKYDFKLQKDQRTFAQTLLQVIPVRRCEGCQTGISVHANDGCWSMQAAVSLT